MARDDPQLKLRLTTEMKDQIVDAARDSGRSVNAEIVARLDASLKENPTVGKFIVQALLDAREFPKPELYTQTVDAMALLYLNNAPAEELNIALRLMRKIRGKAWAGTEYSDERMRVQEAIKGSLEVLLYEIAEYMREQGWEITPPEGE